MKLMQLYVCEAINLSLLPAMATHTDTHFCSKLNGIWQNSNNNSIENYASTPHTRTAHTHNYRRSNDVNNPFGIRLSIALQSFLLCHRDLRFAHKTKNAKETKERGNALCVITVEHSWNAIEHISTETGFRTHIQHTFCHLCNSLFRTLSSHLHLNSVNSMHFQCRMRE